MISDKTSKTVKIQVSIPTQALCTVGKKVPLKVNQWTQLHF